MRKRAEEREVVVVKPSKTEYKESNITDNSYECSIFGVAIIKLANQDYLVIWLAVMLNSKHGIIK
jgi:hypothetical protein